jgi:hypothetical protein
VLGKFSQNAARRDPLQLPQFHEKKSDPTGRGRGRGKTFEGWGRGVGRPYFFRKKINLKKTQIVGFFRLSNPMYATKLQRLNYETETTFSVIN